MSELLITIITMKRFHSRVNKLMPLQLTFEWKSFQAFITWQLLFNFNHKLLSCMWFANTFLQSNIKMFSFLKFHTTVGLNMTVFVTTSNVFLVLNWLSLRWNIFSTVVFLNSEHNPITFLLISLVSVNSVWISSCISGKWFWKALFPYGLADVL